MLEWRPFLPLNWTGVHGDAGMMIAHEGCGRMQMWSRIPLCEFRRGHDVCGCEMDAPANAVQQQLDRRDSSRCDRMDMHTQQSVGPGLHAFCSRRANLRIRRELDAMRANLCRNLLIYLRKLAARTPITLMRDESPADNRIRMFVYCSRCMTLGRSKYDLPLSGPPPTPSRFFRMFFRNVLIIDNVLEIS